MNHMSGIIDQIDEIYSKGTHADVERFMLDTRNRILAEVGSSVSCPKDLESAESVSCLSEATRDEMGDLVVVCNELGTLYREASRFEDSVTNFELALQTLEKLVGTRHNPQCAVIMVNVAGTYRYMGNFQKAAENYAEAAEIMMSLNMGGTYEFASMLNNMALCFEDMGDVEHAMDSATEAYKIIAKLAPGSSEEAISLTNLASLAMRAGDDSKTAELIDKSIELFEALDSPSMHYAAAVNMAAVIAFRRGAFEEALAGFERSAELTLSIFGENKDYASALANQAAVLEKLGRAEEAAQTLARAEEIRGSLG